MKVVTRIKHTVTFTMTQNLTNLPHTHKIHGFTRGSCRGNKMTFLHEVTDFSQETQT